MGLSARPPALRARGEDARAGSASAPVPAASPFVATRCAGPWASSRGHDPERRGPQPAWQRGRNPWQRARLAGPVGTPGARGGEARRRLVWGFGTGIRNRSPKRRRGMGLRCGLRGTGEAGARHAARPSATPRRPGRREVSRRSRSRAGHGSQGGWRRTGGPDGGRRTRVAGRPRANALRVLGPAPRRPASATQAPRRSPRPASRRRDARRGLDGPGARPPAQSSRAQSCGTTGPSAPSTASAAASATSSR